MIVPDIKTYKDYRTFFSDFFKSNKQERATFSHRAFALRINWPYSYLSDLIHGRKKLSYRRAIEFADFLSFSGESRAWLVLLAIADSNEEIINVLRPILRVVDQAESSLS